MKFSNSEILWKVKSILILTLALTAPIIAQSTSIEYPTAVSSAEISGKIAARDIGDSRLTTHYYVLNSNQGDLILTIEAENLNADIDVFYADNLRPVSKISIYSDSAKKISRELYFRKAEKLILKIEGKSPNDDAAIYKISFAGSFLPTLAGNADEPEIPKVETKTESDVVVNSVGTILEVKPKQTKVAKVSEEKKEETLGEEKKENASKVETAIEEKSKEEKSEVDIAKTSETKEESTTAKSAKTPTKRPIRNTATRRRAGNTARNAPKKETTEVKKETAEVAATVPEKPAKPTLSEALEKINLVILFKDGSKIERPMNEISRVTVDRGMLTVVSKNGSIGRYSILDVAKFSIE